MQREQNEELISLKNDLDVRIDSMRRDLAARQAES